MTDATVVVFVAGDVMLGRGAAGDLQRGETPLQWLAPQSRAADVAFCNLECVLTSATAAGGWEPRLFAPPAAACYLARAGIDVVSVANNHALNGGETGAASTLRALHQAGIVGIGATKGDAPWQAWEKRVGGRRVAWVAASAYGPWRAGDVRIRDVAGTHLTEQVRALSRAGDLVFVSLHWGNELSRVPTAGQVHVAHALVDAGAAAVVGHHPHVTQPVEVYRGHPIFYSLGNFVFDRLPGRIQDGFAARICVLSSGLVRYRVLPLQPPACVRPSRPAGTLTPLPLPLGERLVRIVTGHFLRNQSGKQVVVWSSGPDGGGILRAFVRRSGGWRCLAEGHHPSIFDMQVGDIDSDGQDEVVLGLVQRSKLDVRLGRRLYVYSVDPSGVFLPRWRGSGLSRPFSRFRLLPTESGCDLVALEKDSLPEDGQFQWLSIYGWNGFGLRRLWDTPVRGVVRDLRTGRDGCSPYVSFVQIGRGCRRFLILRPATVMRSSATESIKFTARLVRTNLGPPPGGGKAANIHEQQTDPHEQQTYLPIR